MADLIRYDLLVQDALRGVVRQVLGEVARNGLQGEHHFFITFKTQTPGLRLSNRMRERYPDEMTIILQHQFWGLTVQDAGFEVGLSFHNTPERLFVPFAAITMFQDPSVNFGLKFDWRETAATTPEAAAKSPAEGPKAVPARRGLAAVDSDATPSLGGPAQSAPRLTDARSGDAKLTDGKSKSAEKSKPVLAKVPDTPPEDEVDPADKDAAKVVSIDAFRKKP